MMVRLLTQQLHDAKKKSMSLKTLNIKQLSKYEYAADSMIELYAAHFVQ